LKLTTDSKRIMVIAGGEWQVPIIAKAKSCGFNVINTNPYLESPGFKFADIGLIADVLDLEKNLNFAKKYTPDAIITDQSDIAVTTVAFLCEQLNLPGIGSSVAKRFTNKQIMREISLAHGFPTPDFLLCKGVNDAECFARRNGFPFVIKPPASQSSRGVSKVERAEDIEKAYNLALSFSKDSHVLVEGYIGGVELTIDGIKGNNQHICLATSAKTHYEHNSMVANRLVFSQYHPDIDYDALHRQHDKLIDVLGLPFGLTHAEYKYDNGRFFLIEVAARGGGTRISSDIVPLMSGVDNTGLLIKMALGGKVDCIKTNFSDIFVSLDFLHFSSGIVDSIEGVDEAATLPGVVSIGLNILPGNMIKPPEDDRSRHGYVIARASSKSMLDDLVEKVHKIIRVNYV
jgi:carbamoyl-phosphate synthase large subunit